MPPHGRGAEVRRRREARQNRQQRKQPGSKRMLDTRHLQSRSLRPCLLTLLPNRSPRAIDLATDLDVELLLRKMMAS